MLLLSGHDKCVAPSVFLLHQDASHRPLKNTRTPCHLFTLTLLFLPPHCIITPPPHPTLPARAPMSKPNTTDQQLGMQIVSQDKLCAACQLHTWALGWLSVTCVRVPLYLRHATLMTWSRVSLQSIPPHLSACPQPPQPFYPFTHSSPPPTHHATMRQCVTSRREKGGWEIWF